LGVLLVLGHGHEPVDSQFVNLWLGLPVGLDREGCYLHIPLLTVAITVTVTVTTTLALTVTWASHPDSGRARITKL
jgi:hypothetical protein